MTKIKEQYFCICENCSGLEWVESSDITGKEYNELKPNGDLAKKNNMTTSLYDTFFACCDCAGDSHLTPIPFSYADKNMRKKIFKMSAKERINVIERYKILKGLEDKQPQINLLNQNLIGGFVSILFGCAIASAALGVAVKSLKEIEIIK